MTDCIHNARKAFPCGLIQPQGTFRCNVDALQLAALAAMTINGIGKPAGFRMADVGCGCGVVGLATLLSMTGNFVNASNSSHTVKNMMDSFCVGFEKHPLLVQAASDNAKALGFATQYEAIQHDVRNILSDYHREAYDVVLCNPPWRITGNGRLPPDQARAEALFADDACFLAFLTTMCALAKPQGWLFLAVGTERLADVFSFMDAAGMRLMISVDVYRPRGRGVRLHCLAFSK